MPQIALYMVTLAIITIPLILFAVLIVTGGDALHLGPITIPTLTFGRHQDTTLLGSGDFLNKASIYAGKAFHLLFFGDDTFRWNTFYLFGQFYNIIAIPFIIIAAVYLKKDKEQRNIFDRLFLLWLITSLPVLILVEANVNHWNVLWFPLIYFAARGIYFCTRKRVWLRYVSVGIALLLFLAFGRKYVSFFSKPDTAYISGFWYGYKEYLDFAKTKNFERIYFSEIYPFALFNNPVNPYEYNEIKIERADDGYDFERVSGYENYSFYIPQNIEPLPNTAYLIRNDKFDFSKIEHEKFHIERGITYTLLWNE